MSLALDHVDLARIQFALNVSFHILFPSITVALSWFLLYFKCKGWMHTYFYWTKIFALCFALGIVSGLTMSFQFGTNWPGFMLKVGNVAGPLLAYEVLTAFFLEATFLGIMLFGYRLVKPWVHTLATALVAFGTTLSAFWILALNSWMQTPAGYSIKDGVVHPQSWAKVIFNPSFGYHFTHMLLASGLTAAFLVAGVSAFRWLRGDRSQSVQSALRSGVFVAAVLIPIQTLVGDQHGLATLRHQPQKVAAIEAIWKTQRDVPLTLFGFPSERTQSTRLALEVPHGGSLILTHSWHGEVRGIDAFPDDYPPVAPVFWGFRIMVGVALLMLIISWSASYFLLRGRDLPHALAYSLVGMTLSGWVATLSGWCVTEIGRQPWLVSGILRTVDAAARNVSSSQIGISLSVYVGLYIFLIASFISTLFYIAGKPDLEDTGVGRPGREG